MRRREFVTLVGGAAAAWPFAAFGKTQRIAMIAATFPASRMNEASGDGYPFKALFNELSRLGYVEGEKSSG
jgi:putative ABC transport system substrate-binding protein